MMPTWQMMVFTWQKGCDTLIKNLGILQGGSAFTLTRYPKTENSNTLKFKGHRDPLSNFFEVKISSNGREFSTTEAAYQFCKAETMGDNNKASKILHAENGLHAMRIASNIQTDERWQEKKVRVMEGLIKEKLQVCDEARRVLLASGSKVIIEDTPHAFWGHGKDGKGQNMLGKIWMKFRENICKESKLPRKTCSIVL